MGNDPFVVVYFNADAELGVLPSNAFFLDCHCALRPSHRRQLRVRKSLGCIALHAAAKSAPALHACTVAAGSVAGRSRAPWSMTAAWSCHTCWPVHWWVWACLKQGLHASALISKMTCLLRRRSTLCTPRAC